jgi:hypothetical protein
MIRRLPLLTFPLLLAIPHEAFAQAEGAPPPSSLPPLPPPIEPAPAPTTASPPAAAVAPPPSAPAQLAAPSVPTDVPEEPPLATSPVVTFANIPKLLVASVGLGVSSPWTQQENTPSGNGLYAGAEFVLVPSPWFSPRLYGGLLLTSTDSGTCPRGAPCSAEARIGFVGAKGRLTVPIPYVAPFLELGLGMSAGTLTTHTADIDERFTGLTYHVPVAICLSFGERHHYVVDVALSYLFHPAQSQIDGAFALSAAFQIK